MVVSQGGNITSSPAHDTGVPVARFARYSSYSLGAQFCLLMFFAESLLCFTENLNTIGFPCTIRYDTNGILESNTDHDTLRKSRILRYKLSPNRSKRPSEQSKYGVMCQSKQALRRVITVY